MVKPVALKWVVDYVCSMPGSEDTTGSVQGWRSRSKKKLPEALKAYSGWEKVEYKLPYIIKMEDDFFNEVYSEKMKATLTSAAQSIQKELTEIRGCELTPINIFQFLIKPAMPCILDYTQQSLHASGLMQTNAVGLQQVIATMFL